MKVRSLSTRTVVWGSLICVLFLVAGFLLTAGSEAGPIPVQCSGNQDEITRYYATSYRLEQIGSRYTFGCNANMPPVVWGQSSPYKQTTCAPCQYGY